MTSAFRALRSWRGTLLPMPTERAIATAATAWSLDLGLLPLSEAIAFADHLVEVTTNPSTDLLDAAQARTVSEAVTALRAEAGPVPGHAVAPRILAHIQHQLAQGTCSPRRAARLAYRLETLELVPPDVIDEMHEMDHAYFPGGEHLYDGTSEGRDAAVRAFFARYAIQESAIGR